MHADAQDLIERLALAPHPEGGWFRETWRSDVAIPVTTLGRAYDGPRAAATAIHYLLADGAVSRFHRLRGEELWIHEGGHALDLHLLTPAEGHTLRELGPEGARHAIVPAGTWFGAEVRPPGACALVACVMAPGFDARDWELADRARLLSAWPDHADLIRRLA